MSVVKSIGKMFGMSPPAPLPPPRLPAPPSALPTQAAPEVQRAVTQSRARSLAGIRASTVKTGAQGLLTPVQDPNKTLLGA